MTAPPKPFPRYPCLGGPLDGELRSVLDLPTEVAITVDEGGTRSGYYEMVKGNDHPVWFWREVWQPFFG